MRATPLSLQDNALDRLRRSSRVLYVNVRHCSLSHSLARGVSRLASAHRLALWASCTRTVVGQNRNKSFISHERRPTQFVTPLPDGRLVGSASKWNCCTATLCRRAAFQTASKTANAFERERGNKSCRCAAGVSARRRVAINVVGVHPTRDARLPRRQQW